MVGNPTADTYYTCYKLISPETQPDRYMSLKKKYDDTDMCEVSFTAPKNIGASTVSLVGDFNDWNPGANPMKQLKDGGFSVTIKLKAGSEYQFRYLLDGHRWENDWEADKYAPNEYGVENSVVVV
jgi:1,4-alpha-glucan branching enzyme